MKNTFLRLIQLFYKPREYFADLQVTIWDGVIIIVTLFAASFFQKMVWVEVGSQAPTFLGALKQAAINSLMVWCLFCVFFFAIAGIFRKNQNLAKLSGLVGAAGLPVVITTLISALSWAAASVFDITPIYSLWMVLQNGLSWLGLVLSWPGLYGFYLLRDGLKLSKVWAIILPMLVFLFLIAGKILPLFWNH